MSDFQKIPEALMKILVESETPQDVKLSAKYTRSFAYPSMKDRVPVIITKVVDYLSRDKATITKCYGEEVKEEIKATIGELSQLKNQLQTSKKFEYFTSNEPDTEIWNKHLKKKEESGDDLNYYESEWLFAECYVYRRIREMFATKDMLKTMDPFSAQKTELLRTSLPAMESIFHYLNENRIFESETIMAFSQLETEFFQLLKLALWANTFDLSLKTDDSTINPDIIQQCKEWDDKVLVNDAPKLFSTLCSTDNSDKIVDYITDNAGLEILCDLCLADFLITRFHMKKINFRVKPFPWFVSDVIQRDLQQTISSVACYPNENFQPIGKRWQKYLDSGIWTVISDQYWCLGKHYSEMALEDPQLYSELQDSSLIILKGDLNYRKLLQDINWKPTTSFSKAIGDFHPAPLISLRTCKSDVICGLKPGAAEKVSKKHPNWLVTGDFALIQFDASHVFHNIK